MKNFVVGFSLMIFELIIIISGVTCLIIGSCIETSIITEGLLIYGFTSIGVAIGTIISTVAVLLMFEGFE